MTCVILRNQLSPSNRRPVSRAGDLVITEVLYNASRYSPAWLSRLANKYLAHM